MTPIKRKFYALLIMVPAVTYLALGVISSIIGDITEQAKERKNALLSFFELNDGIDLTFAHAVNSQAKIKSALQDSSIMVLEADILIDPIRNIPIMAHPPDSSSDLTLKMFLEKAFSAKPIKGIKLDFKQIEAVKPSLELLKKFKEDAKAQGEELMPILLNADILTGPEKPKKTPVNSTRFIELCALYSTNEALSPGWTTTANRNGAVEGYTWGMVKEMQAALENVKKPVSFPVRASLVARSKVQLLWLLEQNDNYTLTLWHSNADNYKMNELAFLRKYPDRVYYDLPVEKVSELRSMTTVS